MLTLTALRFTGDRALVVGARIASGRASIPRRMMSPRPPLLDGAARHRLKGAGLLRRAFVDVDDEADQHHERGDIVQHVTDRHATAPEGRAETTSECPTIRKTSALATIAQKYSF